MRTIGIDEVLGVAAEYSGQPKSEFAVDEVLLPLRGALASSYAAGTVCLAAGVRELGRGLLAAPPDPEAAAVVAVSAATLLVSRNGARMSLDDRAMVLRLDEAIRDPDKLDDALDWFAGLVEANTSTPPAPRRTRAKQGTRLFGPPALRPIEVTIALNHPVTAIAPDIRGRVIALLARRVQEGLRKAEIDLDGRISFRPVVQAEELPATSAMSDDELWRRVSAEVLNDVHGVIEADLAGTVVSDGRMLQRMLHLAHGGPGLWILDPQPTRGRLAAACAREAGWKISHCKDGTKIPAIVRRWAVKNADDLEWAARSRRDLEIVYEPLRQRLERAWRVLSAEQRKAILFAAGLTQMQLDRTLVDVHYLDTLSGWRLDALRVGITQHTSDRHRQLGLTPRLAWDTLQQAEEGYEWSPEVSRQLRAHVQEHLLGGVPLKGTFLQSSDWLRLKEDLGL